MAKHTHLHLWPGVPLALASAIFFGAVTPFSKYLLGGIDPWMLAGILYLAAGIGLLAVHLFNRSTAQKSSEVSLNSQDMPWLLTVIGIGGVVAPLLLVFGLSQTSASQASLLLNLEGLATMAIAWLAFKENVDRRLLLGAIVIISGALLLTWDGSDFRFDQGSLLIACACIAWGIDNNLTRKISASDPVQIAMIKGLVAGSINLAIAFSLGAKLPTLEIASKAGVLGVFGIGISLVLFISALRHLGTARTGAYFSLAPFIGALLALAILHEALTWQLLLAGILMMFGLWLHLSERHDHEHIHDEVQHNHKHNHDEHHNHDHEGDLSGPHAHTHYHAPLRHKHPHYPDLHHHHVHR